MFDDGNLSPAPCDQPRLIVTVYVGQCISFDLEEETDIPICRICPDAYCKKTCEVCLNGTQKVIDNCNLSAIGNPDCYTLTGPLSIVEISFSVLTPLWEGPYNTCFLVGCENF